jgi:hypothetical protein
VSRSGVGGSTEYFLADGSGTAIDSCTFDVDLPDGSKDTLP